MSDNDWKSRLGMVYSTNPDFDFRTDDEPGQQTPDPSRQNLKVWLDRKLRGGKQASIIRGFQGSGDDLKELARVLKNRLGVGGSAKEGEIIIQGDFRDRIVDILTEMGYKAKKAGG